MRLDQLNALDADSATRELQRCCGSMRRARLMAAAKPFASADAMAATGDAIWSSLDSADRFGAFAGHPRIGETTRSSGQVGRVGWVGHSRSRRAQLMRPRRPVAGWPKPIASTRLASVTFSSSARPVKRLC